MNEGIANDLGMNPCRFCGVGNCGGSCEAARRAEIDGWKQRAEKAESDFDQLRSAVMRTPPGMASAEFIDMCRQLRALGAVKVSHGELAAEFVPVTATAVPLRPPPEEKPMTPEQAREEALRRELGL